MYVVYRQYTLSTSHSRTAKWTCQRTPARDNRVCVYTHAREAGCLPCLGSRTRNFKTHHLRHVLSVSGTTAHGSDLIASAVPKGGKLGHWRCQSQHQPRWRSVVGRTSVADWGGWRSVGLRCDVLVVLKLKLEHIPYYPLIRRRGFRGRERTKKLVIVVLTKTAYL